MIKGGAPPGYAAKSSLGGSKLECQQLLSVVLVGAKYMSDPISNLRHVPSVDQLLRTDEARLLRDSVGIKRLTAIARAVTSELRSSIRRGKEPLANGNAAESLLALYAD